MSLRDYGLQGADTPTPDRGLSSKRETIADEVFKHLLDDILSLVIEPGTHLSEAEVARTFGVSRQPVREALMRLSDLNLLLIRPQRATLVRKISLKTLAHTRFIRAALEVEIVREACKVADERQIDLLSQNLSEQAQAHEENSPLGMRQLDYDFHRLICEAAGRPSSFDVLSEFKAHTDRICRIELADQDAMAETVAGHTRIVDAIKASSPEDAVLEMRGHLAHLDSTIASAEVKFSRFFEA